MHESQSVQASLEAGRSLEPRLSYKFQRLREHIRTAVLNGEFPGRLPGERELARRYRANAKTVNKALCDLTSEGLLIRHIGRGTFVARTSEDRPCGESPRRTFLCLDYPSRDRPLIHRQALLRMLSDRLAAMGHRLLSIPANPLPATGDLPVAAWPPSTRSTIGGLLVYPYEPLSGGGGRLGGDCIAEAHRRHVPMVSLAASATDAKVITVVPDYVDAGFRLADYLIRLGCESVLVMCSTREGREIELVLNGCQTAAKRHACHITCSVLPAPLTPASLTEAMIPADTVFTRGGGDGDRDAALSGLICVGRQSLTAAKEIGLQRLPQSCGGVSLGCILEPGDKMAEEEGLTAYEVDACRLAAWAADLLVDAKPGQRPVEIIIPGKLNIRDTQMASQPGFRRAAATGPSPEVREASI